LFLYFTNKNWLFSFVSLALYRESRIVILLVVGGARLSEQGIFFIAAGV